MDVVPTETFFSCLHSGSFLPREENEIDTVEKISKTKSFSLGSIEDGLHLTIYPSPWVQTGGKKKIPV